jgi:uncharacterized membrane protein
LINRIRAIFQPSESNVNLNIEPRHLAIFLGLVAGSSLIEIAYFIWVDLGYLNLFAIPLEAASLFAGFFLILCSLVFNMGRRVKLLWIAALVSVSIQILIYSYPSGLRIYAMLFMAVLFIALFTYVIIEFRRGILQKILYYYTAEIIIFLVLFTFFTGLLYTRYFPSDESAIDTYAATLFLRGINPYNAANMVNSLSAMHFPYYLGTPLLTGGYVQNLGYPVLSFIAYLPTAILSLRPSFFQETLTIIPIIILIIEYIKKGYLNLMPALFLGIFSSTMILSEGLNGGNGILWASFVMLSYIFLKKPVKSGILFGFALSIKQIPVFVLPFFLILILKDHGKNNLGKWFMAVIFTFLIINGYFIILNPASYVKSILSPELLPIIGYGFGISQISFLGFLSIPKTVFTMLMISVALVLFSLYYLYFEKLRYAIFVFPMIILALNYRVAIEYFLYWVILCFSTIPFLLEHKVSSGNPNEAALKKKKQTVFHSIEKKGRKSVLVSLFIVLCIIPVSAVLYHGHPDSTLIIESSIPNVISNNTSFADSMNITVFFSSPVDKPQDIFFRIVEPGSITNGNGLIWNISGNNNSIKPDSSSTFFLHTNIPAEYLNLNESYRLVVYCSGMVSARTFN